MKKPYLFQNIAYKSTLFSFSLFLFISACKGHSVQIQPTQTTSKSILSKIPSLTYATLLPTTTTKPEPTNTLIPVPTTTFTPNRWITNGPNAGLISYIAIDPIHTSIIYAGLSGYNTIGHGVYKSLDSGRTWISSNSGISTSSILSIVIDPQDPSNVFIAVGLEGVYQSHDSGKTWQGMNVGLKNIKNYLYDVETLAIDPQTPSILYAGTFDGIYKSSNGDGLWIRNNPGIPDKYLFNYLINPIIFSIVIDPKTPTTIFAVADYILGKYIENEILKSIDGGNNWQSIKSNLHIDSPIVLAIDPINTNIIYFGVDDGIYKSLDGGINWKHINIGIQYPYTTSLAIDPITPNKIYAGTIGYGVYKSMDGGLSWRAINNGLSGDDLNIYSLAIDPTKPSIVYAGTMNNIYSIFQQIN